jgi:hypothetical protein
MARRFSRSIDGRSGLKAVRPSIDRENARQMPGPL